MAQTLALHFGRKDKINVLFLSRGLLELNLGWCEGITEVGLQALAQHCHSLRVLDLCGCIKVGRLSMHMQAAHLVPIKALDIVCTLSISPGPFVHLETMSREFCNNY